MAERQQTIPGVLKDARYGQLPGPRPSAAHRVPRTFRIPVDLDFWIAGEARSYGITPSFFLAILCERYRRECEGKHGTPPEPIREFFDELRHEYDKVMADGRVTTEEKIRLTKPATKLLSWLWNHRKAGVA